MYPPSCSPLQGAGACTPAQLYPLFKASLIPRLTVARWYTQRADVHRGRSRRVRRVRHDRVRSARPVRSARGLGRLGRGLVSTACRSMCTPLSLYPPAGSRSMYPVFSCAPPAESMSM